MNAERWRRACFLFEHTTTLDEPAREEFLARECGADSELQELVTKLVDADDGEGSDFERSLPERLAMGLEGTRLGAYRLERLVQGGGMGNVYLARRDDAEFERRVAVKVVRRALAGTSHLERFRRERQVLAQLEHPNIARLYDGGTTSEGQPYIVMEWIDGEPISLHAARLGLGFEAIAELLIQVCSAVDHAERRGLVHCDLKPSNVLVDSEGRPKVVDFGLASLAVGSAKMSGGRPSALTPGYASPEQVAGDPATAASDVYSLGVLLDELCSGAADSNSPDRIPLELRAIALRARREAPQDRYPTAGQLARDLIRYSKSLPVQAVPASRLYVSERWLSRNRRAAVVLLSIVVLVVTVGWLIVSGARSIGTERRELAQATGDLVELLSSVRWKGATRQTLPAEPLLAAVGERIRRDFAERPQVAAELLDRLAEVYLETGHHQQALDALERSLELRQSALGPLAAEVGDSYQHLAILHVDSGRFAESRAWFQKALDLRVELYGEVHPSVAESLADLGRLRWRLGELDQAEQDLRRTVEIRRQTCGWMSPASLEALGDLASLLRTRGELVESARFLDAAEEVRAVLFGGVGLEAVPGLVGRGHLHHERGEFEAAAAVYREALAIQRAELGDQHPAIASSLGHVARALGEHGDYSESLELFDEALEQSARWGDRETPDFVTLLNNRAAVLRYSGQHARAQVELERVLAARLRLLGPSHPHVGQARYSLGQVLHDLGDFGGAIDHFEAAARNLREALPDGHPARIYPEVGRARALLGLGKSTQAAAILRVSLPRLVAVFGREHWRAIEASRLLETSRIEIDRPVAAQRARAPLQSGE